MIILERAWVPLLVLVFCIVGAQSQYIRSSCGADDFRCDNGNCIESSRRCDGVNDCLNQEDERGCDCRADEFRCIIDGACIEGRKRCDGIPQCSDGSDENDCESLSVCTSNQFTCFGGSVLCAEKCNNIPECEGGEDEEHCPACAHQCDGKCIPAAQVCDNREDCSDGSDEQDCQYCNKPGDFRCDSGECLPIALKCNEIPECVDSSDEKYCNQSMATDNAQCTSEEFQCLSDLVCIDLRFLCDNHKDCLDGSDESNCACPSDSWQCRDGQCIPTSEYCDGKMDCYDGTDESECNWTTQRSYVVPSTNRAPGTAPNIYTERPPGYDDGSNNRYPENRYPQPDNRGGSNNRQDGDRQNNPGGDNSVNGFPGRGNGDRPDSDRRSGPGSYPGGSSPDAPGRGTGDRQGVDRYNNPSAPNTGGGSRPDEGRGSSGALALDLHTHPDNQTVRYAFAGGDVVFQCRDEGPQRARVTWRMIGRPIKEGSYNVRGRLDMYSVTQEDAGIYICEAEDYIGYPGSQKRVTLQVDNSPITYRPPFATCRPNEATCANGQCIPKAGVCDGRIDCADKSDEDNCLHEGMCEPNQFKCNNRKCVLKTWICDSEDDCGDGSDEKNCGTREEGKCAPVEFTCASNNQCIPKSFHCDGQSDCIDHSDEIGCLGVHVTISPKPSNVRLNPGDTLILRSEAVGVPVPIISWRLNWGHVPAKCSYTNDNGVGVLTCPNMQPEDSGAYSSEAINNKGAAFAPADAIVIVNNTNLCPRGYFNSEARTSSECIPCFCFGKSTQCRSADLFTYNLPMLLGEGGTRLIGIKVSPNGDVNIDTQPITNEYYYQPLRNGATITKFGDGSNWSNFLTPYASHPYLTLPESYNGNQLKSYGGHIKYTLSPHTPNYGYDDSTATIIIKGKYGNLFHVNRGGSGGDINIEARLTPDGWSKKPDGSVPATRADIMMVLDDIQMILLRADLNNAGVNITAFAMESADHLNVGLGAASLVEECTCPAGYEGLSCQKCKAGYKRNQVGPWLGNCQLEDCPAGTYGDPATGLACRPCPCPLTNRENQFARTCSLGSYGTVNCDCLQGYEGKSCESCAPGYEGNPLIPGNSCQPKKPDNCDPTGTKSIRPPDECVCKVNVQGRYCDQCKDDSFFLSSDFRQGCATCFCTGVTQQCKSSNFRRRTISAQFNVPQIVDQVKIFNSAPASLGGGSVRYSAPKETTLIPELVYGEINVNNVERSSSSIYYWSMPLSFAGDKVTSYGGYLRYELKNVPSTDPIYRNTAAHVQIISENRLTFHYKGNFSATRDGLLNASIQLLEDNWRRSDGGEISRPDFLLALADVRTILIKATYGPNSQLATPVSASIDIAEADGNGPVAYHVEECDCLPGYIGTSCEDCAPGYTRNGTGIYLESCGLCDCNKKSDMCDAETGVCFNCGGNSEGEQCERCKPGYTQDPYGNCIEAYSSTSGPCRCDPRGTVGPCYDDGSCRCKQNVVGDSCNTCRPGTFGLESDNADGCLSCYCSGVTNNCHEAMRYTRVPIGAPVLGDDYGGFSITDLNAQRVIKDHFVPLFEQSELMYTFQFPPNDELYWSLPILPGNRVLSYGGSLSLRQKFSSEDDVWSESGNDVILDGGEIRLVWSNPNKFQSEKSYSYQVPLKEDSWLILNTVIPATRNDFMSVLRNLKRVLVRATVAPYLYETTIAEVSMDTVTESDDVHLPVAKGIEICMCPEGYSGTSCETCKSSYYKDARGFCRKCSCNGQECQLDVSGQVVCLCQPPYTGPDCSTIGGDSSVVETTTPSVIPESTIIVTIISPSIKIQEIGSSVNFTCQAQSRITRDRLPINWAKRDGELPIDRTYIDSRNGYLLITNLQVTDSGVYVCETSDGINTAQASATLRVPGNQMTPPSVEIFPSVKEYYEGDPIELECRVRGNPTPSIRWQRTSNKPLPLSAENRGSFLVIESARVEDAGEYRCIASNNVGSDDRTAVITIRPRPSWPQRDKLTISNTEPTVDEGQSITIVCTGSTNVPAGTIDWIRQDNTLFLPNVRSENGVLYIDYAEPANQGVYICRSPQSNVAPIPVLLSVVTVNPEPEVYNITVSVDRLRIPSGGSGTVECNPVGSPLPLIKWTKHEGALGTDSSQRDNSLIINNARQSDEGYYLCEGTVKGVPVASAYVFVEIERREMPVVKIWPEGEQAVILGAQFELHCRVLSGIPEPYVTWNRNGGRPLSPTTEIQPHNILRFNNIDVNDEGEYTCEARNDAGSASASSVIKVRAPPEITITPSDYVSVLRGEPINVDCRANGYPEPTVSISFRNRQLVPPQPGHANLRIPAANVEDEGDYSCTAESVAGSITNQFLVVVDRGDGGDIIPDEEGSGDPDISQPNWPVDNVPKDQFVIEGQPETVIYCNGTGDVRWSRADNMPLQRNAYQADTRLIILNVSKSDSGEYVCSISEYNNIRQEVHISLVVVSAPKITLRPQMQTVQPGQSPSVECVVSGDDIIDVTWTRRDGPPSSRMEVRSNVLLFHQIEVEDAGQYECFARSRYANISDIAEVNVIGASREPAQLVTIEQPHTTFRVSDNVNVLCKIRSKDVKAQWLRLGTNQYIPSVTYGDGAMLIIQGVTAADAGVYRCVGYKDGRNSFDDFDLQIDVGSPSYPSPGDNMRVAEYTARLGDAVTLPCRHDLELPVTLEWSKEYSQLPSEIWRRNQPNLYFESITEADAGTYTCRVSNNRGSARAMAILTVKGVVPRFDGKSYISLPTIKDAFREFDIEISLKPNDENGLILYNSQNQGREGDYIVLQLTNGVPEFVMNTATEQIKQVKADRPLQLNTWHTIRLRRTDSKITMDVDNRGPFIEESPEQWQVLDLKQPLYIGGFPDYDQLPPELADATGFIGCVGMLILGREEKNIMMDSIDQVGISDCESCIPNLCLNNGFCQEARNERGYMCICASGYAGLNCDRTGEACRPGICGPGKCSDTDTGYKCACPVTHTGKKCETSQSIEYPAFTGSAYLAIKPPGSSRTLKMSMNIKAATPVTDGIIMYCAESSRGYGGFTSLAVHSGRLEFRYDLGKGSKPVVLVSNRTLPANEWTNVHVARIGSLVSLKINSVYFYEERLLPPSNQRNLALDTPIFVGGVDDSITLNNNTGVSGGFNGCIKDFSMNGRAVDIVNQTIQSANVQECVSSVDDRGDIPEGENIVCQCRNGGECLSGDATVCSCPYGFTGQLCEHRSPPSLRDGRSSDPCAARPCRNGGSCRPNRSTRMNYSCDCPLGFAGDNCQIRLELYQSVAFNGDGYMELPASLINYSQLDIEPAIIALAIHTTSDGVLVYQKEAQSPPDYGDYILLRIDRGIVVIEWDLGGGKSSVAVGDVFVNDGERHQIIAKLLMDGQVSLSVDSIINTGTTVGISNIMNADSNIYLGGIPDSINQHAYPGFVGCIEQFELMDSHRGLNLGQLAVAGRNTQRCKDRNAYRDY